MAFYANFKVRAQDKDGNKLFFRPGDEVKNVAGHLMSKLKEDGVVYEKRSKPAATSGSTGTTESQAGS